MARFLEDDYQSTRRLAEDALFEMGDPRGLEAIRERAYTMAKDDKKKTRAVPELVKIITERRARKILAEMTKSKNLHLSIAAKQAVNKLKSHEDPTVAKWAGNVF